MPISLDKVLLVYNTDEPDSLTAANYYIAKRGLTPHLLGLSLGPQHTLNTPAGTYANVVTVANYMIANSIEAVIASALCPAGIMDNSGGHPLSFENVLGTAKYWKTIGRLPKWDMTANYSFTDGYWFVDNDNMSGVPGTLTVGKGVTRNIPYLTTGSTVPAYPENFQRLYKNTFAWQGNPDWVPHGRIGMPMFSSVFPGDTLVNTYKFIDEAVSNENNFLNIAASPIHFLYSNAYSGYFSGAGSVEMARLLAVQNGLHTRVAKNPGSYSRGWDAILPADDYPYTNLGNGIQTENLWGIFGFYTNNGIGTSAANSYTLLPGAWGIGGASFGLSTIGSAWLARGMTAFSGSVYEPLVMAMLNPESYLTCLLQGMSMMESASHSNMIGGWMVSTWGDPLYRPFPKQSATLIG